jgi:mannose-6-phosphate isomerase-like protein (cupin superfamily)
MILSPTDGEQVRALGTVATIKIAAEATGGRLAVTEHEVPHDVGPPPHIHRDEDELLYVLEGTFDVVVGDASARSAPAGTCVLVAQGTVHTTRCTSERGRLLSVYTPGGSEGFFREVGAIDQTDRDALLALADHWGMAVVG